MNPDYTDPHALVQLLERNHGVHAGNACALIGALASRHRIGMVTWTPTDLLDLTVSRRGQEWQLSEAEVDRALATRAWRSIGDSIRASRIIVRALREVACEAGLVCTHCGDPIHGELTDTLAHCDRCRGEKGADTLALQGCPGKGYRRHRTGCLATHGAGPKSRQAFCWDCGQRLYSIAACQSCRDDDLVNHTAQISRDCECRIWQPIIAPAGEQP